MGTFKLRPALKAEAGPIRRLIWQVHINPTDLDWQRFWVAVDENDRLLGCGQIKPHSDGSRELASLAVQPEARQQGVARAIIAQLARVAERPLYLRCRDSLQSFYEKFGFRAVGPAEMPPAFRSQWQALHWLKMHLLRGMPALVVMRLDD